MRWGLDPRELHPPSVGLALRVVGTWMGPGRLFPLDARGFDDVPEAPVLVVSNHSGGTMVIDTWGFALAWYRHFGTVRPLHPAAHELLFATEVPGRPLARLGVIRAERSVVRETLRAGRDVMVMPGGDGDVWRPYHRRWDVVFAGHRGYARIAAELQVPVVPVANAGAHETLVVLADGHRVARWLGLHRLARADVWPVHLSLPWGLGVGPLPHLPWPRPLRYRVGPALAPPSSTDEDAIAAFDQDVRAAVQRLLDELRWEADAR